MPLVYDGGVARPSGLDAELREQIESELADGIPVRIAAENARTRKIDAPRVDLERTRRQSSFRWELVQGKSLLSGELGTGGFRSLSRERLAAAISVTRSRRS